MKENKYTLSWKTILMVIILNGAESSMINLYQYFPHEHAQWKSIQKWSFIRNNPKKPYRMCASDGVRYEIKAPPIHRGLTQRITVKFSYMFEDKDGYGVDLSCWHEYGQEMIAFPKKGDDIWRDLTFRLEFSNTDDCDPVTLVFDAMDTCVNICCLEMLGEHQKAVIVPVGNALNCTGPTRRSCYDPEKNAYKWTLNGEVMYYGKKNMYLIKSIRTGKFSCEVKTENCDHWRCIARSDEFFVRENCHLTSRNCCEMKDGICRVMSSQDQVKSFATRPTIKAPTAIVLLTFWRFIL